MAEVELKVVAQDEEFASAMSHSTAPIPKVRNTFSSALSMSHSQQQQTVSPTPGISQRKTEDNRATRGSDAAEASGGQPYMFYDFIEVEDAEVLSLCVRV